MFMKSLSHYDTKFHGILFEFSILVVIIYQNLHQFIWCVATPKVDEQ